MTPERIMVVGSGTRFISGISHYTHFLACAFSTRHPTSVILMRRLLPRRLYPGAQRVGARIADHIYPPDVRVYDGIDWFWFPSLLKALRLLWSQRPNVVVLQWWTATVAHTYLVLVAVARLRRARVVFEMHEVQDTGEAQIPFAATYSRTLLRLLTPLVDGFVVHSEADHEALLQIGHTAGKPVQVIRHGPFGQYAVQGDRALRDAPADVVNLMFFGTIRPYKGVEDLVRAFESLPDPSRYWLTVVGETWEGWTLPAELIAGSPRRDRITFVNRYVTESEAARWLAGADALVLPYHRSSASGPLHVGMALGLPIVSTHIPALVDAAAGYDGCLFVPPRDVDRLRDALAAVAELRGERFVDPGSWDENVRHYERLITQIRDSVS
jgi:glycosyltransferase involved in cell wall biosynthesis